MLIIIINTNAWSQEKNVPPTTPVVNQAVSDSTLSDSTSTQKPLKPKSKEDSFESKVEYKASDSLRFNVKKQTVFLYGKAEVDYGKTNLKSDKIELDLGKNQVFAHGTLDSSGNEIGRPVFKDGDQEFEAKDIRYNFETKKGLITEAVTQQGDGYVKGKTVKRMPNEVIYIKDGQFCPCKDINAKTYINAKKIKIIPEDKVVTGPANMRLGHIPTPLLMPFGIFPNKQGASSGIVIPKYGYSPGLGYYLQDGGYYLSVNEYLDMQFTGDVYSRGSWGLGFNSNYARKYRGAGNLDMKYTIIKRGSRETLDYREESLYKLYWRHKQDPKSHPYSNFSADVNIYKNNRLDINGTAQEFLSNTFKSNVNYNYRFPNSPFNLTVNGSHSVNSQTQIAELTLPQATLTMDRIYPFKRKNKVGKSQFYEKIGFTYNTNFLNKIVGNSDSLFSQKNINAMRSGLRHSFGLTTNAKFLKVFSFQPYVNYTDNWEFKQIDQNWSNLDREVIRDTIGEFGRYGSFNTGANLSTKIYGMFLYRGGPVRALRHVITPSVGFNYTPSYENADYRREYISDTLGTISQYTVYDYSVFSRPPIGKENGSVRFDLRNNLEMKVRNRKDTTKENATKKIKLIDQLNFTTNYDLFADSMNWSDLGVVLNTTLFNYFRINYNSRLDLYTLEESTTATGESNIYRVNKLEISENGRIGRFTGHQAGVNFVLSNKKILAKKKKQIEAMKNSTSTFLSIPWNVSVGYNYTYSRPQYDDSKVITQTIAFNGNIQLTENWKFDGNLNFDIEQEAIAYTRFSLYRDLNCWEARISVVPTGGQQNYSFAINLKPAMFKDLKIERKRNFYDFQ